MNDLPKVRSFSKWDPIFDNTPTKVGPEFGDLQQQKEAFAEVNRASYQLQPEIPLNVAGLINRTNKHKPIPSPARWFRRTSSFERNGMFNIQTPVFNTRFIGISFFLLVGWGYSGWQAGAWQLYNMQDGYENGTVYDKLTTRNLPPAKIWIRPG